MHVAEAAGERGWGGADTRQRFMKDFLFISFLKFFSSFLSCDLKFVPERAQTLISCPPQVATTYCESHKSVVKIKRGEPAGD